MFYIIQHPENEELAMQVQSPLNGDHTLAFRDQGSLYQFIARHKIREYVIMTVDEDAVITEKMRVYEDMADEIESMLA